MRAYAAYHRNKDVLNASSSGGMFTALSDCILDAGGIVVGSEYDYDLQLPRFVVCKTKDERDKLRGSIYIQSFIDPEIYKYIEDSVEHKTPVLFMGTACQCKAISNYLCAKKVDTSNFYTCDILCHGVGSPGIWRKFISRKKQYKIRCITFKDKRNGWKKPLCIGKGDKGEFSLRDYSWLYFSDSIMRPACYCCKYASTQRETDVTIGDFWKVDSYYPTMYNQMGTSIVFVSTIKGEHLFGMAEKNVCFTEVEVEKAIQNNMIRPTLANKYRANVFKDYNTLNSEVFFLKWRFCFLISKLITKMERFLHIREE